MKRKVLSIILVLALFCTMFTGCGKAANTGSNQAQTETKSEEKTGAASKDDGTPASEAASENVVGFASLPKSNTVKGEINQQTYPLATGETLTAWTPVAESMGTLADPNEGEFWQWYEEKTGVHVEFTMPAVGTESENFQLLFASDKMPDIIMSYTSGYKYSGGEDAAIEDGYFVDIAQNFDKVPNYVSWLNANEASGHAAFTDTGKMYGLWGIWDTLLPDTVLADQGLVIRKDFLDKVGMDVPTTYDEWEKVLIAFRDQLGIEAPFYTSKKGIDHGEFMAGFGTAPEWYQKDGVVCYGPLDDEYKEYLSFMNRWYNEGLLDRDFATRNSSGIKADDDMNLNDKVGAYVDYGTRLSDTYVSRGAANPDFWLVGVPQPKKNASDPDPEWRPVSSGADKMHGVCWSVSADSKKQELALRWLDGFYAQDIYLNANYGIDSEEGTVWRYADDRPNHRIGIYDFRYSNPNGLDSATVLAKYWTKNPPIRVEGAQIEQADDNKQEGYKIWSQYDAKNLMPSRITMTVEEGSEYASLYTSIETYVQECNVKFIMGLMSLDEYDSYRETLKSMGLDKCIAIQQAAYDRFKNR